MAKFISTAYYSAISWKREKRQACVAALARQLPDLLAELKADAVAVTGTSGESLGYALADATDDVRVIVVKKPGVSSHSEQVLRVESPAWRNHWRDHWSIRRYVFLDDCVDSGTTRAAVRAMMGGTEEAGVVLYAGWSDGAKLQQSPRGFFTFD